MCLDAMSNFGIDVWHDNKKVFSACWNSSILKDFELISLKRGPWIPELLKKASLAGVDA